MKGYMPQQVEVWYIIPAIRKEFARIMIEKGLSQKEAAEKLGVTEAAVSQYVKKKRATEEVPFGKDILTEMEKSSERIIDGASIIKETQRIIDLAWKDKVVCCVSKKHGFAKKNCCECFK